MNDIKQTFSKILKEAVVYNDEFNKAMKQFREKESKRRLKNELNS